jgi:hypothetical protein
MVLIIKSKGTQEYNYSRIAAQMINMETNQLVYDNNAKELYADTKDAKRPKFNIYTHNSVEFDFSLTTGVVVLYLKSDSEYTRTDHATIITEEIRKFPIPLNFTEIISNSSKHYIVAKNKLLGNTTHFQNSNNSSENNKPCYRKIIVDPYYLKKAISTNSANFIWLIVIKNEGNFRGSHISIQELDPDIPTQLYLNRSISTIIYDDINMINIRNNAKQINYPALTQYRMFSQNQILEEPIYISWEGGLRFEIYFQFTGNHPRLNKQILSVDTMLNSGNNMYIPIGSELKLKNVELKRLNPDKPWEEQLLEPFDYKKQEEDEINLCDEGKPMFPNDICFISKIPLWEKFYVVKIKNATSEFDIAVAPSVVHNMIRKKNIYIDFVDHISEKTYKNVSMVSLRICAHPRTFLEVLDMIPNKINPIKKNIMRCMEMYGSYSTSNDYGNKTNNSRYSRSYYVMDKTIDQIYVGLLSCNDTHISQYQNTNTIIFRVILVDFSQLPDILLFPNRAFE